MILPSVPAAIRLSGGWAQGWGWHRAELVVAAESLTTSLLLGGCGRIEAALKEQAMSKPPGCVTTRPFFPSLSEPLLGYYKPDVLGIVLESKIGPNRKKV